MSHQQPRNTTNASTAVLREQDAFVPRRWIRGGHLQTLAGNFQRRINRLPAPEDRLFQVEPEVQVLCHCHWQPERKSKPVLVIVHGLEGSSESGYVIGTANKAWMLGMSVVRMNMRNCGGTESFTPTLYHSGLSADVGQVVERLAADDGLERIALSGFSMGGNLVLKLAGEWGKNAPGVVKAVAAVSPAMDLATSADALHRPINRLYEWNFLIGLNRRMKRKAKLFPDRYKPYPLRSVRSIREFDDRVTAPHSGFLSAADYYERASSTRVADQIAIPTLVIHSSDDPFIILTEATRAKLRTNPHIMFVETTQGGHCGFLAECREGDDGRWAERKVAEFIAKHV